MPSPLFLARPSGLYVRFFVPADLRPVVGSRFLVRPLHAPAGDAARLVAACMAVAVSKTFEALRKGSTVDLKKALEAAAAAGRRDLTLGEVKLPNGATFSNVRIDTEQDRRMFAQAIEDIGKIDIPTLSAAPAPSAPVREVPWLSLAIDAHTSDLAQAGRNSKTVMESRHTLKIFLGVVGDLPVSDLTEKHIRAFNEAIRVWPSNATKRDPYRGKSVSQVLALAKANREPVPAAATLNKHRQRLAVFLNSLERAKHIGVSPLRGLPRPAGAGGPLETGRPFTLEELRATLEPSSFDPWAAKYPHRFWGPLLGLFSGARVNEIAQLYTDDITEEEGVWGLHIAARFPNQKLKNPASLRFVPLARPILDAGFLAFVEEVKAAGHPRLFPHLPATGDLGYGRQLSKQFRAYLLALGIDEAGMGFHAFRHTFINTLTRAGLSELEISRLTGHTVNGSVMAKHYIDPPTLPERVAALAKFAPPVVLPTYTPGQFARALKAVRKEASPLRKRTKK
jgi:integrase